MTESTERSRVAGGPRAADGREWEVFVRPATGELARHAGSLTAPSAELAHEQAATLFGDAAGIWLCPASETVRFESQALGERAGEP